MSRPLPGNYVIIIRFNTLLNIYCFVIASNTGINDAPGTHISPDFIERVRDASVFVSSQPKFEKIPPRVTRPSNASRID